MVAQPDAEHVRRLLERTADAARSALDTHRRTSTGPGAMRRQGERAGQYAFDLRVDAAVRGVLEGEGVGVLSEESGLTAPDAPVVVVVDPVDGSTNASRGIPWYACSLCAVDSQGPWSALVVNLATDTRWAAQRGGGATRDGVPITVASTDAMSDALVVLNGRPPTEGRWRQYRALGATALDLCAVADGSVDATIDCTRDALGPWDYLGGMLVLTEAGGVIADARGRDLVVLDPAIRRTPVSACSSDLLTAALAARER